MWWSQNGWMGECKTVGSRNHSEIHNSQSEISPDTFIQTDWNTALDTVAGKFTQVKTDYGGDAFAVMVSAKCTNEENYIYNKFTRQMLATHSIDHCARL